jgi:DNA-binding transcriptional ArsR family regulator
MADAASVIGYLEPTARMILSVVAKSRLMLRGDLLTRAREQFGESVAQETIQTNLDRLKSLHLIDEKQTPVDDFNTLYITAEGLDANRRIGA